jgi:protein Tex
LKRISLSMRSSDAPAPAQNRPQKGKQPQSKQQPQAQPKAATLDDLKAKFGKKK